MDLQVDGDTDQDLASLLQTTPINRENLSLSMFKAVVVRAATRLQPHHPALLPRLESLMSISPDPQRQTQSRQC